MISIGQEIPDMETEAYHKEEIRKVKFMAIHDNSIGRSAKEILRMLQASKFVEEHPGQVCPASWEPGENTLTVSVDLIGKI